MFAFSSCLKAVFPNFKIISMIRSYRELALPGLRALVSLHCKAGMITHSLPEFAVFPFLVISIHTSNIKCTQACGGFWGSPGH